MTAQLSLHLRDLSTVHCPEAPGLHGTPQKPREICKITLFAATLQEPTPAYYIGCSITEAREFGGDLYSFSFFPNIFGDSLSSICRTLTTTVAFSGILRPARFVLVFVQYA